MAKNKNNKPKEVDAQETESQDLAPKLSTYLAYGIKKLEAIEPGHREIDIAAKDAVDFLKKAVDLVEFIEDIQAK